MSRVFRFLINLEINNKLIKFYFVTFTIIDKLNKLK